MVAHAFHGVAAALQSLAEDLRVLDLLRVDLAWVEAAGEVTELLCRIVLTVVDPLGDDVEAVDETPGKIGRERLVAGVAEDVEQRDRKRVGAGKSVSVRVGLGGRRIINKKKVQQSMRNNKTYTE